MSAARAGRADRPGDRAPPSGPGWWVLAIAVALGLLLYLRSPIDLVPDRLGAIGLLDDLLVLILAIGWLKRRHARDGQVKRRRRGPRLRAVPPRSADPPRQPWDPYAVLGIEPGATPEEIGRAYREQMKLYHPDRVAALGEELRALAHAKSLEIQRAYEEIGPRRR